MPCRSAPSEPVEPVVAVEGDADVRPAFFVLWLFSAAACVASVIIDGEMSSEGTIAAMCVLALPFAMRK